MPIILNHMPFSESANHVTVRGERVMVGANQIILWVSLALKRLGIPNPAAIPFPAILDTGHTHTFSLHERHLFEWASIPPDTLPVVAAVRERGSRRRLLLRAANIWVHPNRKGELKNLAEQVPHLIEADRGIAVYPGSESPRLPILGLRAIAENNLVLNVNGARREATLKTPKRWWPFA
jgi:hypothetical protein